MGSPGFVSLLRLQGLPGRFGIIIPAGLWEKLLQNFSVGGYKKTQNPNMQK